MALRFLNKFKKWSLVYKLTEYDNAEDVFGLFWTEQSAFKAMDSLKESDKISLKISCAMLTDGRLMVRSAEPDDYRRNAGFWLVSNNGYIQRARKPEPKTEKAVDGKIGPSTATRFQRYYMSKGPANTLPRKVRKLE